MRRMQPFAGLEHQAFVEGDGPATAVLLHGFPGTPAEVRPLAAALVAVGWRVRAPLLPGFGSGYGTLRERRWTEWQDAVADALATAAASGAPVMAVGFSMGAALTMAALEAGAPADAMVLIAPFTRMGDRRAVLLPLLRHVVPDVRPYEQADFDDPFLRRELLEKLGDVDLDDPATRERVRREVRVPTAALDELRRAAGHAWRVAPRLPARPTLVVQGMDDPTVTPESTVALLRRLRGAPRRLMLEGADHRVMSPGRARPRRAPPGAAALRPRTARSARLTGARFRRRQGRSTGSPSAAAAWAIRRSYVTSASSRSPATAAARGRSRSVGNGTRVTSDTSPESGAWRTAAPRACWPKASISGAIAFGSAPRQTGVSMRSQGVRPGASPSTCTRCRRPGRPTR